MGSAANDQVARRKLRKKLEERGVDPAEVVRRVEELRERQGRGDSKRKADIEAKARRSRQRRETREVQRDIDRKFQDAQQRSIEDYQRKQQAEQEAVYARLSPDDTKHRPITVDPLLRGATRATGQAAKAVRRGKTVTKHRYDQEAASG